jgi:hypothetical protein
VRTAPDQEWNLRAEAQLIGAACRPNLLLVAVFGAFNGVVCYFILERNYSARMGNLFRKTP